MSEVARFRAIGRLELLAWLRAGHDDAFATIGRQGQSTFCGRAAIERLETLATRTLNFRSDTDRALDFSDYVNALGASLIDEYFVHCREVDIGSTSRMIDRAKRLSAETVVAVTHHMPCDLFDETDPDRFAFGPVQFITTTAFLAENGEQIRTYSARTLNDFARGLRHRRGDLEDKGIREEAEAFTNSHVKRIVSYFSEHDWVASVTIPTSHFSVSQRRAERVIDAALDALRLFVLYAPERLRRANSSRQPIETHHLYSDSDGNLHASAFYAGKGATAGEDWYDHHTTTAAHLWKPLTEALGPLCADQPMDELNQRLLDALEWFGQAVQEPESAAAVVKYTAALERLTMTSHVQHGIEKLVIRRVLLLNQDREDKALQEIERELGDLYECRSNLMHGSMSPTDPRIGAVLRMGWEITRWSILEAVQLFASIREHGTPTRKGLELVYDGGRRTQPRTTGA